MENNNKSYPTSPYINEILMQHNHTVTIKILEFIRFPEVFKEHLTAFENDYLQAYVYLLNVHYQTKQRKEEHSADYSILDIKDLTEKIIDIQDKIPEVIEDGLMEVLSLTILLADCQTALKCCIKLICSLKLQTATDIKIKILGTVFESVKYLKLEDEYVINELLENREVFNIIKSSLLNDSKEIRSRISQCLLSLLSYQTKIIKMANTPPTSVAAFLENLWKILTDYKNSVPVYHVMEILCCFAEFYFDQVPKELFHISNSVRLYEILYDESVSDEKTRRKQSIFLLKKTVEYFAKIDPDSSTSNVFQWNSSKKEKLLESWLAFFSIFDNLEENQSHLILPSFNLMPKINILDDKWRIVLLRNILRHENTQIVIWGINYTLDHVKPDDGQSEFHDLLDDLLKSLNNTTLYCDDKINLYNFEAFIIPIWGTAIEKSATIDWLSVPMFYVVRSFVRQLAVGKKLLLFDGTKLLKNLSVKAKYIQNTFIRSAVQILILDLFTGLAEDIELKDKPIVLYKISQIAENDVLVQGLSTFGEVKNLMGFVKYIKDLPADFFAKLLVPILLKNHFSKTIIKNVFDHLLDTDPLRLAHTLLRTRGTNVIAGFDYLTIMQKAMNPFEFTKPENCSESLEKLRVLELLIKSDFISSSFGEWNLQVWNEVMIDVFLNEENSFQQKYIAIRIICGISNLSQYYTNTKPYNSHLKLMHQILANPDKIIFHSNRDPHNNEMYSCFYDSLISIVRNLCYAESEFDRLEILNISLEFIELGGMLGSVMNYLKLIFQTMSFTDNIRQEEQQNAALKVVNRCFTEVMALSKNEIFWPSLESFLDMILSVNIKQIWWRTEVTMVYFKKFQNQAAQIRGLANIIYSKLLLLDVEDLIECQELPGILMDGLLFGDVPRRDQRIESETCQYIIEKYPLVMKTRYQFDADAKVRAICLAFLLKVDAVTSIGKSTDLLEFYAKLKNDLLMEFARLTKTKPRYYADSYHHRLKLRIVQTLALLYSIVREVNEEILNMTFNEINQPNIIFILEMILADTIDPEDLLILLNKSDEVKINAMQSLFAVLYIICKRQQDKNLILRCIESIFPWTMGQHFGTRLYAQITILKLLAIHKTDKYSCVQDAINKVMLQQMGNAEKNAEKLLQDFRFNDLNPQSLLSIANIFHHIPRITGMAKDEILTHQLIEDSGHVLNFGWCIKEDRSLEKATHAWIKKRENIAISNENNMDVEQNNVQMKISPTKASDYDVDVMEMLSKNLFEKFKKSRNKGLVVVASLVTRIPNLGGLARTCEVFGVQKLILDSVKHAENREFQTLSMSAEKWLEIEEIKPWKILEYCIEMKRQGYCIVGAEQTAKSVSLADVVFPKNSILLLGHEKEGLPGNLITLLDIVVEIPQVGVIRSLNVHVTGSIFIYEYAKQHKF